MPDNFLIIDLPGTRFVSSGSIRHMDMSELISVICNSVANTAFIDLHMICLLYTSDAADEL